MDSTPYDNELRLRGKVYNSGIGALANSRLQVKADGQFNRFSAQVGMDDSSLERLTKVRFEVYGDGRLLAQSPALGADDAPFTLEASVADVEIVDLVAHEIGKGSAPAIVTWGEAALRH